ncbi:AbrB/MazE/SpoVT family DNA-binding domain-containing protein [Gloeothece verrucosa]|uniref:Transcriptional regulator/antitoxin, MazE n=1 Tax=Gloeothece verrucosa (strain PCC 7822) TaxID=497965 RepID=E0UE85_GLOV7|nr:AbrB/MazE/SpoVT family DNA-binding domain-containing protein [Gloeothece verrucosa]ADN14210.1 transcriptional regulator/antitoxin, MazE [Gloeothece verrucosa PCC 7822]
MVIQKLSQWGNSLGIRLPQAIIQEIGLNEGDLLRISLENNRIILSPARPKYTLSELLQNISADQQHEEIEWGDPQGDEIW